jgi:hypothetical protein
LQVKGRVAVADPIRACGDVLNPEHVRGRVAIVERGDCMFVEKVRVQYLCIVVTALLTIASKCFLISSVPSATHQTVMIVHVCGPGSQAFHFLNANIFSYKLQCGSNSTDLGNLNLLFADRKC